MAIFSWFDTSQADQFAKAIADDLVARLPAKTNSAAKALTPERVHNAQQAIISRAQAFSRNHKLNWYSKAHLGNTFRWQLVEQGYDKVFVDTWTRNVLVALSSPNPAQKAP